jgi:hypothetical protein
VQSRGRLTLTNHTGAGEALAVESVVSAATRLASVFAKLLRGAVPGRPLAWSSREQDAIRAAAEELCSTSLPLILERTVLRWQGLLDVASCRLSATTRRRPDVLALTRDALSVPEHPYTRTLVDYAICARLRQLYGVGRTLGDLEQLRRSFQDLEESFEGRQRRRIKKDWSPHAHFLLDVVAMSGHVWRAPDGECFDAYCGGFTSSPFGVADAARHFGPGSWPELFGQPPQLSSVLRRAYGIPLGVPGLDEALGALQVPFPGPSSAPGSITLVCGPSGSGRTTLLLTIASTLSDLGFAARLLSARESRATIDSKLHDLAALTPSSLWSRWLPNLGARHGSVEVVEVDSPEALRKAAGPTPGASRRAASKQRATASTPRAFFLDGVASVLESQRRGASRGGLGVAGFRDVLVQLRDSGASLFLSCTDAEREALELDRVADNVLGLGFHADPTGRHTSRVLSVDKTRLQSSQRDRHVLNVGETGACWVSPSLHTVNRGFASLRGVEPSSAQAFHLPHRVAASARGGGAVSLREGSHVLVHGRGSSGKAALALACALAPHADPALAERPRSGVGAKRRPSARPLPLRTLVVSFLYTEPYYRKLATRLLHGDASAPDTLTVWTLYPGYIEAETFISSLQKQLTTAELLGRPYGAVVLDGIHNLLLEFPLLRADDLLWPTLFRLLRSHALRAVSTYSSFDIDGARAPGRPPDAEGTAFSAPQHEAFFRSLLSSCDYVFEMRRDETSRARARAHVRVESSSTDVLRVGDRYMWENDALTLVQPRASRRGAPEP